MRHTQVSLTVFAALSLPPAFAIGPVTSSDLQEVTVTATRRETRLLETPVSMTVISSEVMRDIDADGMEDILRLVPGMSAIDSGPGQKRYALRGLQSAGEPEVALYYDEIPIRGLPGNSLDTGDDQPDVSLWDVDRIEVLRGPQGTLYGNGSIGGAIRIQSKRPILDQFQVATHAEGALTHSGTPSWKWDGMVNIPLLADRLAVRLVGYDHRSGGWIDEIKQPGVDITQFTGLNLNWAHTLGGRASFTLKMSDQWTIEGIGYYQDLKTGNTNETYPDFATADDPYVAKTFIRTPWEDTLRMFNLISTYHFSWADWVVTGSYQDRDARLNLGATRTNVSLFGCTVTTWNQTCFGPAIVPADSLGIERVSASSGEVRLVSNTTGALQWTVGAFAQPTQTTRAGHVATTDSSGYIQYDPATATPVGQIFARDNQDTFDQYAVFEDSTYKLTGALGVSVGLRWFHSYRSDRQTIVQPFLPGQPSGPEPFQHFSESALFKKFEVSYASGTDSVLYAQAAQGFRAGGPNYPGGFATSAPAYGADWVWDYELGWKDRFADGHVSWTNAIFRMNWSRLQQLVPTALFSYIVNAGSARSDGFESEVDATWDRVTLTVNGAFNNAHLVGPQPASSSPQAQLREGDALAGVPRWTASASATYSLPVSDSLAMDARIDYSYQSGRNSVVATASPAFFEIRGGGLTNAHLSLRRLSHWQLGLHVENLMNRFVPLSGKALDGNRVDSITAAPPRTLTLSIGVELP